MLHSSIHRFRASPTNRLRQLASQLPITSSSSSSSRLHSNLRLTQTLKMSSTSLPKTMRAIVVEETGGPEVLLFKPNHPLPTLEPNSLLIKNTLSGINYIDTYFRSGTYPSPKPEILGREAAGTIVSIGESVDPTLSFQPGDRVVWTNWTGAYAEYTAVPADRVVKIPSDISDSDAAGGYLMGTTALSLLTESYNVKRGDTILVHAAAGGTGLLMVQVAKSRGATVIGTAGGPEKCSLALQNGADHVIDYTLHPDESWVTQVKSLTPSNSGVDAVFDGVGQTTWSGSLDVVKRKGSVIYFGASSGPIPDIPIKRLQAKNLKLMRPTMTLYMVTREEIGFYSDLFFQEVRKGGLRVGVFRVYDLEDVGRAHEDLQARRTRGKLLVRI